MLCAAEIAALPVGGKPRPAAGPDSSAAIAHPVAVVVFNGKWL
jgi:hypothetical protein